MLSEPHTSTTVVRGGKPPVTHVAATLVATMPPRANVRFRWSLSLIAGWSDHGRCELWAALVNNGRYRRMASSANRFEERGDATDACSRRYISYCFVEVGAGVDGGVGAGAGARVGVAVRVRVGVGAVALVLVSASEGVRRLDGPAI